MSPTFSPDDIDKAVENANGEAIGPVTEIDGDTARVEPSSGVVDSIRAALGWRRGADDTVRIREDAIASVSDDVIRLESESGSYNPLRIDGECDRESTVSGRMSARPRLDLLYSRPSLPEERAAS
ncbi:hypothetical protein [Natrinema ejinorense]|uniref:Uncharacterized protein n=1 Tax=Natrinema ejinorense TaxID=373386 RepID=A0A2A5QT05_9EURY|nr:hypothetical protein [Natrinema ejinorense]PCR89977.1 hypothetical protein CP557_05150 [Natrinema ejinorense]